MSRFWHFKVRLDSVVRCVDIFGWRPTGVTHLEYDSEDAAARARQAHRKKPFVVHGMELMMEPLNVSCMIPYPILVLLLSVIQMFTAQYVIQPPRANYRARAPSSRLHITNLPTEITSEEVSDFFKSYGEAYSVYLCMYFSLIFSTASMLISPSYQ